MYMYFMSEAPVGVSWQLPDYSIFNLFVCFSVSNYVFSTIKLVFNLLIIGCLYFTVFLAQWGERSLSERTAQVLFPVRPDKTYTVFC